MPFYEYVCTECGRETEMLQKISEPPAVECPACHAQALVKQVSAAGFRLKGAGWYETDFKSGGDKKRNLVGEASEGKGGGESAKSDSEAKSSDGKSSEAKPAEAPKTSAEPAPAKKESKPDAKPAAPAAKPKDSGKTSA